jgi:rubrerythrin
MYIQLTESTEHPLAFKVFTEIASEERARAWELPRLLHEISLDEAKLLAEGAKEVHKKVEKRLCEHLMGNGFNSGPNAGRACVNKWMELADPLDGR